MALILDTNALSAILIGDPAIGSVATRHGPLTVPAIVLGEYRYGLKSSTRGEVIAQALETLIRRIETLDVDGGTARHYADIRWELRQDGTPIPENDVWIAAVSRRHGLPILSRDSHFDAVSGIRRLGW